jgi:hypothetical protein
MAKSDRSVLGRWVARRELLRWRDRASQAEWCHLSRLRGQWAQARTLRDELDHLIYVADSRLALPAIGSSAFHVPFDADWGWRPQLWRAPLPKSGLASVHSGEVLGDEVGVFHDCDASEISLRQVRNFRESDLAPFALRMDVFAFSGTFLSIAIDLPQAAIDGLRRRHLIRLDTAVQMEKPVDLFARLNIKHGPNTEQIVLQLPLSEDEVMVEFDLAYTNINEKRIEKAWVDLIFQDPAMNELILRDVTLCRRPRAEL